MKEFFVVERQQVSPEQIRVLVQQETIKRYRDALDISVEREAISHWRALDDMGISVRIARQLCDALTSVHILEQGKNTVGEQYRNVVRAPKPGTRSGDFLRSIFFDVPLRPDTVKIVESFRGATDASGAVVNVAQLLLADNVAFSTKYQWFTAKLLPVLRFLDGRDAADAQQKAEEYLNDDDRAEHGEQTERNMPPPASDTLDPSMDEMEPSKEGEPGAWFTVRPARGGFWPQQSFDLWDENMMRWKRSVDAKKVLWTASPRVGDRRIVTTTLNPGTPTVLPMAAGYIPDSASVKTNGGTVSIFHDGDRFLLQTESNHPVALSLDIGYGMLPNIGAPLQMAPSKTPFGEKGENILQETEGLPVAERAERLRIFVRETLKYSNDSSMNAVHRAGNPMEYFLRIEWGGLADCDIANTYFLALCRRAGISGMLIAGHYIQQKSASGATVMHSGTAHAWSRIWDDVQREWIRMDATPKGDPNMEEEENDDPGAPDDDEHDGDFGEQDAMDVSNEELAKMQDEVTRKAAAQRERKEATDPVHVFAKEANISVAEARNILEMIAKAKECRDSKGRNILKRVQEEFGNIVQKNLRTVVDESLTTMSRGRTLRKPVRAYLDARSGSADPRGFARKEHREILEQMYGGFDVIFVCDKSGSMNEKQSDGITKASKQQTMIFLLAEALHGAAKQFRRARAQCVSPIDIRLCVVSFGNGRSRIELPLGETWGPREQTILWKSMQENIGGGTPDFLGLETAAHVLGDATLPRLRLLLGSTDGESDDKVRARKTADDIAGAGTGTVVEVAGVGTGAKSVTVTYGKRGTWLPSYDALPEWVAEHVVTHAQKLIPRLKQRQ